MFLPLWHTFFFFISKESIKNFIVLFKSMTCSLVIIYSKLFAVQGFITNTATCFWTPDRIRPATSDLWWNSLSIEDSDGREKAMISTDSYRIGSYRIGSYISILYKSKYKKVGVLLRWIVKSKVSSIGPSSERNSK